MKTAGISARSESSGALRPRRRWRRKNEAGRSPSQATISPSSRKLPGTAASAAATSGNWAVTSSSVREKRATRSPALCACARMPSNLSSTAKSGSSASTSSAVSMGDASMKPIGWKRRNRISWRRPAFAATAVSPMSPESRRARATASRSAPKAAATASSTVVTSAPILKPPDSVLRTYLASTADVRRRISASAFRFSAGFRTAASARKNASTSAIEGPVSRSFGRSRETASPRSPIATVQA